MKHIDGKTIIVALTEVIDDLHKHDEEQKETLNKIMLIKQSITYPCVKQRFGLSDILQLYLKYSDSSEELYKKIERLCQLILTNPELINVYIKEYNEAYVNKTFETVNELMQTIATRRREQKELREWVVQQQLMRMGGI